MERLPIVSRCFVCGDIFGCVVYGNNGREWHKQFCATCEHCDACAYRRVVAAERRLQHFRDCAHCAARNYCAHKMKKFSHVCSSCSLQKSCANSTASFVVKNLGNVSHGVCSGRCQVIAFPIVFDLSKMKEHLTADGYSHGVINAVTGVWRWLDAILSITDDEDHVMEMKSEFVKKITLKSQ